MWAGEGGRKHGGGGGEGGGEAKTQSPAPRTTKDRRPDRPINTDGWRRYGGRWRRDRSDCFILFARQTGDLMRLICGRSVCGDARRDCYRWPDSDTSQSLPVCRVCLSVCLCVSAALAPPAALRSLREKPRFLALCVSVVLRAVFAL